jgi:hypothetical protein
VFKEQTVFSDASSLSGTAQVSGLVQNTSYKVCVLPVNTDGVLGTVVTKVFTTTDSYNPIISGVAPSVSSTAAQEVDFSVVITFNEPVVLGSNAVIQYGYYSPLTGLVNYVAVPNASITVAGNKVTIPQPVVPMNGGYVFLSIGANSILDAEGNAYAGITSGLTGGGSLTGFYWRVKFAATNHQQILPASALTTDVNMAIILDYPVKMRKPNSNEGGYVASKVLVKYTSGTTYTVVQVPDASVTVVQDTLVKITIPRTAVFGETITFSMAEGAMRNVYGNPSAAIEFGAMSWLVSYGYSQSLIISPYQVVPVDNTGATNATLAAQIVDDATSSNVANVLINGLVKNYFGLSSEASIPATFDGDFGTISVNDWIPLFSTTVNEKTGSVYFANRYNSDPVVGQIASDGSFNLDGWGFYFYSDDETLYGWLKRYNTTTWTKGGAVKAQSAQDSDLVIDIISERKIKK